MNLDTTKVRSVDSNLFITVSGPPGCGATTFCESLSKSLDCGYVSGGDIFREIAADHDMSLSQLIAKSDETNEIDFTIDQRLRKIAEMWGTANKAFILEARLAGWLAGNRADFRIWLDAPEEVRVNRARDREEMESEMRVREVSEAGQYKSYYDVDLSDRSFYDLVINTARWSPEATLDIALTAIEEYQPTDDEGAFQRPDLTF